ncbi:hypothetical protein KP509_01G090600 [Ceratopteris richardii]|uniref:Uncharacterized protein n=1 Tax=Ceratopteris richardii TaxID=49495 RepID=A0A8T2VF41_CERRI|nr:hypothetical protein KP509_01G090600 [Ceratopteris richardii]
MDHRGAFQHDHGRSRGPDGGGYGTLPSSSGRGIPPRAVPSLSTGQGFYTVESLQGATMVPPPQIAPPPPRFLPPPQAYTRELPSYPPHPSGHGELGPFDRRFPLTPVAGRKKIANMVPPDLPYRRSGGGMRGPLMPPPPYPPPAFIGDPRMPGFRPGWREPPSRGPWGSGKAGRHPFNHGYNRSQASQRNKSKKQGQKNNKLASQMKTSSNGNTTEKRSSTPSKQDSVQVGPGWCAVCKIDCLSPESLNIHMTEKSHIDRLDHQPQGDIPSDDAEMHNEKACGLLSKHTEEACKKAIDNQHNGDVMSLELIGEADNQSIDTVSVDVSQDENRDAAEGKLTTDKKRVLKDIVSPNKKACRPAIEESENTKNSSMLPGVDHDSSPILSSNSSQLKDDSNGQPAPGKKPLDNNFKSCEHGLQEVRDVTDLENGTVEQSAVVQ